MFWVCKTIPGRKSIHDRKFEVLGIRGFIFNYQELKLMGGWHTPQKIITIGLFLLNICFGCEKVFYCIRILMLWNWQVYGKILW